MSKDLKPGAQGIEVRRVQVALKKHHIPVTETGKYDAQTEKAVRHFQSTNKLQVTGIVDEITRAWLFPFTKVKVNALLHRRLDFNWEDNEPLLRTPRDYSVQSTL